MSDHRAVLAVARKRILTEADAVRAVANSLDDSFVRAAESAFSCSGKVFIGGSGTSGAVARRMAHIMSVTGTPAVAISPMDSLHGASGVITPEDLVILISHGGASQEVVELASIAQLRGAQVLSITKGHDTPLANKADMSVVVTVPEVAQIGGLVATGITLAQSAWGDALAEVLMRGRGYTWRQFMTTHPAGAVGAVEDLPSDPVPLDISAVQQKGGSDHA